MAKPKPSLGKKLEKIYIWCIGMLMFFWQSLLGRVLFCLSTGIIVAAIITGSYIYTRGPMARQQAQQLPGEHEQSVLKQASAGQSREAPVEPAVTILPEAESYGGYIIIGKIEIQKTGQQLPVIAGVDDGALDVSFCYYMGALPGEMGNMVVTGHNLADGAIFGNLDLLAIGDDIILSTSEDTYRYEVYEFMEIKPGDVLALDEYQGSYALTLMTCTDHGNSLLVKCRRVDGNNPV